MKELKNHKESLVSRASKIRDAETYGIIECRPCLNASLSLQARLVVTIL